MVCAIAGATPPRRVAAQPAPPAEQPAGSAESSAPAAPVAATPAPQVPPLGADPRSDAAWQLYHAAFAALMQGDSTRARQLASALLRDHGDHAAARRIRDARLGLAPGAIDAPPGPPSNAPPGASSDAPAGTPPGPIVETPSRAARAELALFQSLHGLALGTELCFVVECDSAGAALGLSLLGAGIGAIAAVSISDLTPGQRGLLDSGTAWGAVNAGLLMAAAGTSGQQSISAGLIAGQTGGLALGAALFRLHPTSGQIALANSGGIWAGALAVLLHEASGADLSSAERSTGALIAIDAGIAAGGYLASRWTAITRAQTLVIDAGGIAGAVGGGAIAVLISGSADDRSTPALAAVGAVAGLGIAGYLTREWGDGASSVQAYVAPPARGRGGVAGLALAW